jgi:ferredoxin
MRIIADTERCIGAGMCVLTAPDVFDQDDDGGWVSPLTTRPDAEHANAVRRAVETCPSGAITVEPSQHH